MGREVTPQAVAAVDAAAERFDFVVDYQEYDLGGERYLRTGEVLPESVQDELTGFDAILLGAVGTPDVPPGVLERGLLLKLRFDFDQYVNLRPVKLYEGVPTPIAGLTPDRCDLTVIRENTEGLYTGIGGFFKKGTPDEVATQESVNTRKGVERVIRYSYELAQRRRNKLTVCHKTNVLTFAADLWWRTAQELSPEYPSVELDYVHVDAACLYLVNAPDRFDVVVTDNLFGDIITDLGAAVQGGLGLAASGNIDPEKRHPSMFEPVHGSAPDIAGKGIANPCALLLGAAQMLDHIGMPDKATALREAIVATLEARDHLTPDLGGTGTTRSFADAIASRV